MPKVTVDFGMGYIYLKPARTLGRTLLADGIHFDFDSAGHLVGIEIADMRTVRHLRRFTARSPFQYTTDSSSGRRVIQMYLTSPGGEVERQPLRSLAEICGVVCAQEINLVYGDGQFLGVEIFSVTDYDPAYLLDERPGTRH